LNLFAGIIRADMKEVEGEAYARKIVDKVVAGGARCIKVMYQSEDYTDERKKLPIVPLSLIGVIVDRAHFHSVPVAIHHAYRKDLQNLLDSNIPFDSIEHITTDEELSNAEVKKCVERGAAISSTLSTYGIVYHGDELEALIQNEQERFEKKPIAYFERMIEAIRSGGEPNGIMSRSYMDNALKFMSKNLKKLLDAGVKIVFGTDTGVMSPTGCPHWELEDMVKAGMKPLDALKSATSIAADVIHMPELGRLRSNKIADIVLLRKNPLENIGAVEQIAAVIRDGYLIHKR
jgi:imidazolonepropionase-like amidohydrolase